MIVGEVTIGKSIYQVYLTLICVIRERGDSEITDVSVRCEIRTQFGDVICLSVESLLAIHFTLALPKVTNTCLKVGIILLSIRVAAPRARSVRTFQLKLAHFSIAEDYTHVLKTYILFVAPLDIRQLRTLGLSFKWCCCHLREISDWVRILVLTNVPIAFSVCLLCHHSH